MTMGKITLYFNKLAVVALAVFICSSHVYAQKLTNFCHANGAGWNPTKDQAAFDNQSTKSLHMASTAKVLTTYMAVHDWLANAQYSTEFVGSNNTKDPQKITEGHIGKLRKYLKSKLFSQKEISQHITALALANVQATNAFIQKDKRRERELLDILAYEYLNKLGEHLGKTVLPDLRAESLITEKRFETKLSLYNNSNGFHLHIEDLDMNPAFTLDSFVLVLATLEETLGSKKITSVSFNSKLRIIPNLKVYSGKTVVPGHPEKEKYFDVIQLSNPYANIQILGDLIQGKAAREGASSPEAICTAASANSGKFWNANECKNDLKFHRTIIAPNLQKTAKDLRLSLMNFLAKYSMMPDSIYEEEKKDPSKLFDLKVTDVGAFSIVDDIHTYKSASTRVIEKSVYSDDMTALLKMMNRSSHNFISNRFLDHSIVERIKQISSLPAQISATEQEIKDIDTSISAKREQLLGIHIAIQAAVSKEHSTRTPIIDGVKTLEAEFKTNLENIAKVYEKLYGDTIDVQKILQKKLTNISGATFANASKSTAIAWVQYWKAIFQSYPKNLLKQLADGTRAPTTQEIEQIRLFVLKAFPNSVLLKGFESIDAKIAKAKLELQQKTIARKSKSNFPDTVFGDIDVGLTDNHLNALINERKNHYALLLEYFEKQKLRIMREEELLFKSKSEIEKSMVALLPIYFGNNSSLGLLDRATRIGNITEVNSLQDVKELAASFDQLEKVQNDIKAQIKIATDGWKDTAPHAEGQLNRVNSGLENIFGLSIHANKGHVNQYSRKNLDPVIEGVSKLNYSIHLEKSNKGFPGNNVDSEKLFNENNNYKSSTLLTINKFFELSKDIVTEGYLLAHLKARLMQMQNTVSFHSGNRSINGATPLEFPFLSSNNKVKIDKLVSVMNSGARKSRIEIMQNLYPMIYRDFLRTALFTPIIGDGSTFKITTAGKADFALEYDGKVIDTFSSNPFLELSNEHIASVRMTSGSGDNKYFIGINTDELDASEPDANSYSSCASLLSITRALDLELNTTRYLDTTESRSVRKSGLYNVLLVQSEDKIRDREADFLYDNADLSQTGESYNFEHLKHALVLKTGTIGVNVGLTGYLNFEQNTQISYGTTDDQPWLKPNAHKLYFAYFCNPPALSISQEDCRKLIGSDLNQIATKGLGATDSVNYSISYANRAGYVDPQYEQDAVIEEDRETFSPEPL
jgi:hypothetical protein